MLHTLILHSGLPCICTGLIFFGCYKLALVHFCIKSKINWKSSLWALWHRKRKVAAVEKWFWQWLCWNPPSLKSSFSLVKKKEEGGRERVCERNRGRPEEKRRETSFFGREVIPILWVTLLREARTPTSLQPPRISPSHAHAGEALLLSFLFKEKGCPGQGEDTSQSNNSHQLLTFSLS